MSKYSYSRFLDDCEALIKLSKHQNNKGGECFGQWQRREGLQKHLPGNCFLVSSDNVRLLDHYVEASPAENAAGTPDEEFNVVDEAALSFSPPEKYAFHFRFHIVFHTLYQSPVLYFSVSRENGQEITTKELLQTISMRCKAIKQFVSIGEHPVLHSLYYFVHPCETLETMRLLLDSDAQSPNFLLSWLTIMQPITGFNATKWYAEEPRSRSSVKETENSVSYQQKIE
ncbi:unnamed protein product [Albugo candida]|uniref:Ubiquitin-like-conjugating enzyme ATG10 n=1 Tax=Albugo candida TaxID=65357 RepID=A0A024G4A1_9STRA|nr:unnamed protein product [Albugo candida]|eukprot:CCI41481.1 unnamed protein product [Albugo candida]